jgi:4-alpha-glucanotransferase
VRLTRLSGILLHPSSLPGRFGIGDLGPEAYAFVDWLESAGQTLWQVLPLGPTGYGDSPYQLFSAFAGNPMLISPERLREQGLLSKADVQAFPRFPADYVDFGPLIPAKLALLTHAYRNFQRAATPSIRSDFERFCEERPWLEDYALFIALKQQHGVENVWTDWEPQLVSRHAGALNLWRRQLESEVEKQKFWQWEFARQWQSLRAYARERDIRIMGDLPIYVAHDSADVWSCPDLFELNEFGQAKVIAGVPPDYFSATGQRWGNPIYNWERAKETGFAWWVERFRATMEQFDLFRLDHFRGFQAYWEIPASEPTALNGVWKTAPGQELFTAARAALGDLPIIAENLGVITPEVEAIRKEFGFPGMSILQFAFGKDPQAPDFKPHNYPRDRFAYTGTHDNDTVMGWWNSSGGDSTRTLEDILKEKTCAEEYLAVDGPTEMNWVMLRALFASVAAGAGAPVQDVLGLGSESRFNIPGTLGGNWRWRMASGQLTTEMAQRLKRLVDLYDRGGAYE